ncbi:MAG: lactate racemase domain-containing protein [Treponema sp.]|jgi:nickel-dependent lactate racemase|nr:lactate racemase domain-containing protein [Treponema sp.]
MRTFLSEGSAASDFTDDEINSLFSRALALACAELGKISSVLLIPPDVTRFHSRAGFLTGIAYRELTKTGVAVKVLPALGTHVPLTPPECERMFPDVPQSLFMMHDWRNDVVELARIDRKWIERTTAGAVSYDWPVQVNKVLRDGCFDLIVSLGQVVPHEVIGMANHAKNLFVGTGGKEAIDKSHFAGACFGMEKMMGRTDTPVRAMFDEGLKLGGAMLPPVFYALTVISARSESETANSGKPGKPCLPRGSLAMRGLFCGFGRVCFEEAAALSRQVNVDLLDEPIHKAVVYLEPEEFRTTWLGNKAVYRTRMAMADNGELLIVAPGLERFGEDKGIDALIRKHGYRPSKVIKEKVSKDPELANSLSAAAHLIHGSSEGRFTVRYCPGPGLSRQEIESVGFEWGDIGEAMARYDARKLTTGWNTGPGGEKFFFVPNPALGLWALRDSFSV